VCNWLDGSDADDQDLDGHDAGSDYFYVKIRDYYRRRKEQELSISYYSGGKGHFYKKEKHKMNRFAFGGHVESLTELHYVEKYVEKNHDNTTDPDYIFVKFGSDNFREFANEDGDMKEYARGVLAWTEDEWDANEPLLFHVKGEFIIVWS
jgi:hypothetical protein